MSKQSWISFRNNFTTYSAFQHCLHIPSLICTIRVNPSDAYFLVGLIRLFPQSIHGKYFSFFDMMILFVFIITRADLMLGPFNELLLQFITIKLQLTQLTQLMLSS